MSPQRRGSKRGSDWKPPRDRREIAIAVMASLAVVVVTAALVWFLRPNRDSGSSSSDVTPTSVTAPSSTTLPTTVPVDGTVPGDGTVAPTTAPAATSTP
jgi:hypothetical protein